MRISPHKLGIDISVGTIAEVVFRTWKTFPGDVKGLRA